MLQTIAGAVLPRLLECEGAGGRYLVNGEMRDELGWIGRPQSGSQLLTGGQHLPGLVLLLPPLKFTTVWNLVLQCQHVWSCSSRLTARA